MDDECTADDETRLEPPILSLTRGKSWLGVQRMIDKLTRLIIIGMTDQRGRVCRCEREAFLSCAAIFSTSTWSLLPDLL